MVSTRRQAGVAGPPTSGVKRTIDAVSHSENEPDSEDDYEETKPRNASSSKRRKSTKSSGPSRALGSSQAAAKSPRRRRDLSILPTVPLDILYEIVGQLGPKDLLSLSRTNKLWRGTVVSPETDFLWKNARKVYDAPDPAGGFTEQGWARLLFENACERCGTRGPTAAVDWRLLKRVCIRCKRTHLMYEPKFTKSFPGEDKATLSYVPHTYTGVSKRGHSMSKFYWDEDIKWALGHMKALCGDALEEWKQKAVRGIETRDELVGLYEEWSKEMKELAMTNADEGKEKRLKAVTQRFLKAGYELVDIQASFTVSTPGIGSGTPHVTDAAWTRLRPQLEPHLVVVRNQRVEKELRPAVEERTNILKQLCSAHLSRTVRPSERYYYPPIEAIRVIPDFISIIEADKGRIITAHDFELVVENLGQYTAEHHEVMKSSLKTLIPEDRQGTNLEPPCDFARHVFRRVDPKATKYFWVSLQQIGKTKDEVLIGWPMVGTHRFPEPTRLEIRPGVYLPMPADFAYNLPVSRTSSQLVSLAGLSPATATVQDMDAKDPRFVHKDFDTAAGYPVFSWRAALGVSSVLMLNAYGMNPCQFRLANVEEEAEARKEEEVLRASAKAWSCNHCVQFLSGSKAETKGAVVKHLQTEHDIVDPKPLDDYFVNERCRHVLEKPHEILVPDVQKYQCGSQCEGCSRLEYRRFTKEKMMEHLKKVFPQMHARDRTPVEGTHYFAVASERDALGDHKDIP